MGDHLVLCVDKLITSDNLNDHDDSINTTSSSSSSSSSSSVPASQGEESVVVQIHDGDEERVPLVAASAEKGKESFDNGGGAECRICQEEDDENNMEVPCRCSGSLKFAHRKCVQRWCNEKGSIICEICHQQYSPGYTAPPQSARSEESAIDMSETWGSPGTQFDLHDPRLLAMAAAERHFLEAEYDEYAAANASGAAFCRSAALILMALLLLRHAFSITNADDDDDTQTFFSLFLMRAAAFLLPCYIMAWAISILQRRRQRQEAQMSAAEVAFFLQAGHARGLHYAVAPISPSQQEIP